MRKLKDFILLHPKAWVGSSSYLKLLDLAVSAFKCKHSSLLLKQVCSKILRYGTPPYGRLLIFSANMTWLQVILSANTLAYCQHEYICRLYFMAPHSLGKLLFLPANIRLRCEWFQVQTL
jgi:hypothetical protein